jgi:hypothetical protein
MPPVKTASDLYGLPLEEFTARRNELVKSLKAAGEKDEAARVAKLRKPSTPAWAVNQLVRTQSKRIKALFEAGDAIAEAQAHGQPEKLRQAAAKQRAELAGLMDRAEGLLDAEGRTLAASTQERVGETLRAAAIDPESRTQVEAGCLTRELQFTGLAGFSTAAAAPASPGSRPEEQDPPDRQKEIKSAKDAERRARHGLQAARKELRQAERELAAVQERRAAAVEAAHGAQQALDAASEQLEKLQRGGR